MDGGVGEREERPIAAGAHALAGVVLGAALADDDAAGEDLLATIQFDAEPLGLAVAAVAGGFLTCFMCHGGGSLSGDGDRKSTRLNSSHQIISYAVFCLKKKKKEMNESI